MTTTQQPTSTFSLSPDELATFRAQGFFGPFDVMPEELSLIHI